MRLENHQRRQEATDELERWLVTHAEAGVPERALVAILRRYATTVDTVGYVPRLWVDSSSTSGPSTDHRR